MGDKPRSVVAALFQQMRPHQWVKNLLLFVPVTLAHELSAPERVLHVIWATISFSFLASAVYTVNDLSDMKADAEHPRKRQRPLVTGALSRGHSVVLIVALTLLSAVTAAQVPSSEFYVILVAYAAVTSAYSLWLKRWVLIDVIVLSALYSLRIVAGGAAAEVHVSTWLLTFSLFFFTSLAFLKRYAELLDTVERSGRTIAGRGYHVGDAVFVQTAGLALGFISVLVFTFYVNGPEVSQLYTHPDRLWGIVPLLLYWIGRLWLRAHRGAMHDDPIVFALRDPASYLIAALASIVLYWAAA